MIHCCNSIVNHKMPCAPPPAVTMEAFNGVTIDSKARKNMERQHPKYFLLYCVFSSVCFIV